MNTDWINDSVESLFVTLLGSGVLVTIVTLVGERLSFDRKSRVESQPVRDLEMIKSLKDMASEVPEAVFVSVATRARVRDEAIRRLVPGRVVVDASLFLVSLYVAFMGFYAFMRDSGDPDGDAAGEATWVGVVLLAAALGVLVLLLARILARWNTRRKLRRMLADLETKAAKGEGGATEAWVMKLGAGTYEHELLSEARREFVEVRQEQRRKASEAKQEKEAGAGCRCTQSEPDGSTTTK